MSSTRTGARVAMTAAWLGLAVLTTGCGGSNRPGGSGLESTRAQFVAYAQCIRSHGISDFPDPTTPAGGGIAFSIDGGPGSDLNRNNPRMRAARSACRTLFPGGQRAQVKAVANIPAGVRWARCLRSHGVPSFPDPNRQGAFDSGTFDPSSPAFQAASAACRSEQPTGAVSAVPGQP